MHKSPLVLICEVSIMGLQETKKMCVKQHGSKTVLQIAEEKFLLHVVCHLPFRSQQEDFKKSIVNVNCIRSISIRTRSNAKDVA